MNSELLVFVRDPAASPVKSRMAAEAGPLFARAAYEAFLADLAMLLGTRSVPRPVLVVSPPESAARIGARFGGLPARGQTGGDLGERLLAAFFESFAGGAARAMVIGSDAPELGDATFDAADTALGNGDGAVLVPASDGGYVLLGFRRESFVPSAFSGIDWSTPRVAEQTAERIRAAGGSPTILETGDDVDTIDDLRRLAGRLTTRPAGRLTTRPAVAPATRRWLEDIGWIEKGPTS